MIDQTRNLRPRDAAAPLRAPESAAWIVAIVAAWLVMHLYAGLVHEAILYTVQGLASLRPDLWAQDIYLRFGAPQGHGLFTALYALLINCLGVEHAAQLLTFGGQLAFFTIAWLLARALLTPRQALAGLLLLVALPGHYGASEGLRIAEDFVTPRLLAEALVMAALLCWTQRRLTGEIVLALLALVIDPLSGIIAASFLVWLHLASPRPRLGLMLAAVALAMLLLVGWLSNAALQHFNPAWYQWVPENMPRLQFGHGTGADWGLALAPLGVLYAATALLEPPLRQLMQVALGIGLAAIALTVIGAEQLHLILITQTEPWRCLWLSSALATLLAPLVATRLWHHSVLGRASMLLLLAQYLLMSEHYAPLIAVLTFGVLTLSLLAAPRIPPQYQRHAVLGASLVFLLALVVAIANYFVLAHYRYFPDQLISGPVWLKNLREAARNGLASFVLLAVVALLAAGAWRRATAPALLLLGALACAVLAPPSWSVWTRVLYQDADKALFASWRSLIAPGTEVLFVDNPLFVWIALERPSYLSRAQLSDALASREAARVLSERESVLRPYVRAMGLNLWDPDATSAATVPTLTMACAAPDLQFVVARIPLQATPIASVAAEVNTDFKGLRLYRCPSLAEPR